MKDFDWKEIRKTDAHVHLLPEESLAVKKECDPDCWGHADPDEYLELMEEYNIAKAVLVPINEQFTYCREVSDTNKWLGDMTKKYPDKFMAFADVVNNGGYFALDMPFVIREAQQEYGLSGLKLHPSNLGIEIDSLDMVPVIREACDLGMPIMIHSYPYAGTSYDCCSPSRIHKMTRVFPDGSFIISHIGGHRWQDVIGGNEYVDISSFLPEMTELYGIEQTNRSLRAIGVDRLIFATDYPQVYKVKPGDILKTYCDILNMMDFTKEEAEKIAYGNMEKILKKRNEDS
ncbi:MAG: amidohydrolase [Firmicutes bacterium]|nr:amidohydrolase [[Eubacterium] siraeum]MCM1488883.1 amidohydrolase [Bacillota bacterium]